MTNDGKRPRKLDQIRERFPGKQINRLVSTCRDCPLKLPARLVYSYLLHRSKREGKNISASARYLSKLSGMTRETVAKAMKTLERHGLVELTTLKRWRIKKMPDQCRDWFGWRKGSLAYHYFPQPAGGISIIDALIYIADVFEPGKSNSMLAGRFQVDRRTVAVSRKKIAALEYSPDWWEDIKFKTKKRQDDPTEFLKQFSGGGEKLLVARMLSATPRWRQQDVEKFIRAAKERYSNPDSYDNLMYSLNGTGERSFDNIMRQHRESGKPEVCGLGLLLHKYKMGKTEEEA